MRIARMNDERNAARPETRIIGRARYLARKLRRKRTMDGRAMDAGLLEQPAMQHGHYTAAVVSLTLLCAGRRLLHSLPYAAAAAAVVALELALAWGWGQLFGAMFPDMNDPYDPALRAEALRLAKSLKVRAFSGVYTAVTGPSYETPTEVRMYRTLGGDVVGMSVVPETIAARQLKLRVAGVCWISNFASGISRTVLTHEEVLELGDKVSVKMRGLLEGMLRSKALKK